MICAVCKFYNMVGISIFWRWVVRIVVNCYVNISVCELGKYPKQCITKSSTKVTVINVYVKQK